MRSLLLATLASLLFTGETHFYESRDIAHFQAGDGNPYPNIGAIPLPPGFHRLEAAPNSFAAWLRAVPLKKNRTVYLFNGRPKTYQGAQFAVLDISVGHTDLQQCADAVMRLRAEYQYARQDYTHIEFISEQGTRFNYQQWAERHSQTRNSFDNYLNTVFNGCSTRTLEKQLVPRSIASVLPGDVLIRGGAPGHAMIVVDVAEDARGQRIYLLAQSYMPAQDIHIVKNPHDPAASPWYPTTAREGSDAIETPEWMFTINQLRGWPKN